MIVAWVVTPFFVTEIVALPAATAFKTGGSSTESDTTDGSDAVYCAPVTAIPKLSRIDNVAVSFTSIVRAEGESLRLLDLLTRVTVTAADVL